MHIHAFKFKKIYFISIILFLIILILCYNIYANTIIYFWNQQENSKDYIKWVEFAPSYWILEKTSNLDIKSHNEKCITDSLMIDHLLKMPKWNPAIKGNKKVKSIYPLKFIVHPQ
jgi:hypothetical protein